MSTTAKVSEPTPEHGSVLEHSGLPNEDRAERGPSGRYRSLLSLSRRWAMWAGPDAVGPSPAGPESPFPLPVRAVVGMYFAACGLSGQASDAGGATSLRPAAAGRGGPRTGREARAPRRRTVPSAREQLAALMDGRGRDHQGGRASAEARALRTRGPTSRREAGLRSLCPRPSPGTRDRPEEAPPVPGPRATRSSSSSATTPA